MSAAIQIVETYKFPGRPARQEPTRLQLVDTTAGAQEGESEVAFSPLAERNFVGAGPG